MTRTYNYKNIKFEKSKTGVWMFQDFLPGSALRWAHWSRFFTDEERNQLDEGADKECIIIMQRAIDRAWKDQPVYNGHIKYR